MTKPHTIPSRCEIPAKDRWDLGSLFSGAEAWDAALEKLKAMIPEASALKGGLCSSADFFLRALSSKRDFDLLMERLGNYANLRQSEDEGEPESQARMGRFMMTATEGEGAWSWFTPELQALSEAFIEGCLADPRFADYAVFIKKLRRFKPHVLGEAEERLLALQAESAFTAAEAFSVLTNVDFDFGCVDTPEGCLPLSQSSFSSFLRNPDRSIRRAAYEKFFAVYDRHKNSLAALYAGSVKYDKYLAQARNFPSARAAALFPDKVPEAVYDNLIATIHDRLPSLHEYYELRKRALKLDELRHYDIYVPLAPESRARHSFDEAAALVLSALAPLGEEYVSTLRAGIESGWIDKYENKGKTAGAFSSGGFSGEPYILLNYKDDVLHDVFTLAHEAGHSMHSWHAARANPFMCYEYTIFEAEVASTFNEQLLFRHLYDRAADDAMRVCLVNAKLDDLVGTLFRQTMFAEFERRTHAMLEAGEPLTLESLRAEYRSLLTSYFGPSMKLEPCSDLECLRIPHFYRAFYVYKYATGISASIALSQRVLSGGGRERDDYFAFLRSGGSRYPIDALKVAGVDMSEPAPIREACDQFSLYTGQMKRLLKL